MVDLGWNGTCGIALKYLLEEKKKLDITVCSALVGAKDGQEPTVRMANGDLFVYGFARNMNYDLQKNHMGKDVDYHNLLMEILFTAPEPSFLKFGYKKRHNLELLYENRCENLVNIQHIHNGIQMFAYLWIKWMNNVFNVCDFIDGRTVLIPIQFQQKFPENYLELLSHSKVNNLSGIIYSDV